MNEGVHDLFPSHTEIENEIKLFSFNKIIWTLSIPVFHCFPILRGNQTADLSAKTNSKFTFPLSFCEMTSVCFSFWLVRKMSIFLKIREHILNPVYVTSDIVSYSGHVHCHVGCIYIYNTQCTQPLVRNLSLP